MNAPESKSSVSGGYRERSSSTTTAVASARDDVDEPPGCCQAMRVSLTYTAADMRRRPRNIVIGIIATFLLVFFTGLILLGVDKAPYVILRLCELSVGEMDIIIYGGGDTPLINYTDVAPKIYQSKDVRGAAPRWMLPGRLRSQKAAGLDANASNYPSAAVTVLVVDTALEPTADIGRAWPYRQLGYGEAQAYYSAIEYIDVQPNIGERMNIKVDILGILDNAGIDTSALALSLTRPTEVTDLLSFYINALFELNNIEGDSVDVLNLASFSLPVTLADAIESANGKYSSTLGNVVLMDASQLLSYILDTSGLNGPQVISPNPDFYIPTWTDFVNDTVVDELSTFRLQDAAMLVVGMFTERYDMYYADTGKRERMMTAKTSSMMEAIGLTFDGDVLYPIALALDTFDMFKVLLVSSFVTVVIGVIFLGCLLLFALLRINADERQFELAMIRAQGIPKNQITFILVTQTLAFSVPGTAIGVGFVIAANAVLEAILANFTKAPSRAARIPVYAVVIGAVLGLVLPLLATWRPVRSVLSSSLRDALDVYRQAQNETKIVMQRLENVGLAPWQIALGLFLTIAGFIIYYLMPMSFIYGNTLMFFILLDLVLVFLVAGICMVFYILEPFAERCVLFLLLWGQERRLGSLIKKNLVSHRERNSTAFLMFMLTVASLMAAGAMFTILANVSSDLISLTGGAPVSVTSNNFEKPLDAAVLNAFLQSEGSRYAAAWSYVTFSLGSYTHLQKIALVNAIGGAVGMSAVGVSETFMDSVYPRFTMLHSRDKRYDYPTSAFGDVDVIRSMYASAPLSETSGAPPPILATGLSEEDGTPSLEQSSTFVIPVVLGSGVQDGAGVSIGTRALLQYEYETGPNFIRTQFALEPRALMNRVSGFVGISSLPAALSAGAMLMPETYFKKLLNPARIDYPDSDAGDYVTEKGLDTVFYQTLYIQLKDGVTRKDRQRFVNGLQAMTDPNAHTTTDTAQTVEDLESIRDLVLAFFYFTAALCIVLCAFMMWVTFISNVQLNAWSIGVLRSLGFRLPQLIRASIYEALCIVISAFVLGMIAGVVIGVVVSSELTQILILPFAFDVPYILIIIILVLGLLAAVVGSSLPFIDISRKSISTVLRGS